MVEQIKTFDTNVLALEVIDGFTEVDEKICQKFFQEKLNKGYEQVNVLVKLDELKISHSSSKAFMEDTVWALRNYKSIGHLAIVAHSKMLKALVPIDNLFFQRASKGRYERYFDVSQLDEAFAFVTS
ncbi:MAG: STAS/SEC14 domain-containing protein [Flavobacteriaceae bacterium]|nr:STAS/SEC14 domain-containing protein [Mangrovimonas sp.]MCB0469401.1 STAS/SEC14 domain-containing protein [Flavobacteriaceae bacterium]MCB0428113.1 STAS/SEC14 domain-containing protein [Mangrovimonas sp.]MCB0431976.1 STAS/SEC14 domain-containing protein [Mangrovimonas sp.]MCB0435532.1 STAS/SEC14 domain-containing protein [Mangrovimonas sp.]